MFAALALLSTLAATATTNASNVSLTDQLNIAAESVADIKFLGAGHHFGDKAMEPNSVVQDRSMVHLPTSLWPNKTVHYAYDDNFKSRIEMEKSFDIWRESTCINFVQVENNSTQHHLKVYDYPQKECFSDLGKKSKGLRQAIFLHKDCLKDTSLPVHEIGHVLGMIHEQSRPDRDDHLKLIMENVNPAERFQFKMDVESKTYGTPYDYFSLLQYPGTGFMKNGKETMEAKDPRGQALMGKARQLSHWNKLAVNRAYNCYGDYAIKCGIPANYCNEGLVMFEKSNNTCTCSCAEGTSGTQCETVNKPYAEAILEKHAPNQKQLFASTGKIALQEPSGNFSYSWYIRAPSCHNVFLNFTKIDMGNCYGKLGWGTHVIILKKNLNTAAAVLTCKTELAKIPNGLTIDSNWVNIAYKKTEETTRNTSRGLDLEYTWLPDPNCKNKTSFTCEEGNCPAPADDSFMSIKQIDYYLKGIANNFNHTTKIIEYARTSRGNTAKLLLVKPYIKRGVRNARHISNRTSIWVEAGFEATNRASTAAALHFLHELVTNCQTNCEHDYYIVPLVNPDGYDYTFNKTLYSAKKNREPTSKSECLGVNVFYNFRIPADNAVSDPCSETYQGPTDMSAPEIKYITTVKKNVKNILMTVVLEQSILTSLGYLILSNSPVKLSTNYVKTVSQAFNSGVNEVPNSVAYQAVPATIAGSVLAYNQHTFGKTILVSLPSYSYPDPKRIKPNGLEFTRGILKLADAMKKLP